MTPETFLFILVIIAGAYMAWNIGANDVANAMGTSVGSGALTLKQAVIIAAILEFSGAFFFGSHVSETIQNGIIDSSIFQNPQQLVVGMLSALLASGIWLQLASYYGWPISTTHSIVGGVVGFGAAIGGIGAVYWDNVAYIATSWVMSPLMGGVISYGIFEFLRRKIFYAPDPVFAAKRLTPPIVFFVVFVLSLIMLYKGLTHLDLDISLAQTIAIGTILATICATLSHFLLKRVSSPKTETNDSEYHPEVSNQLEKARRHLLQVQAASRGAVQYQASEILEEIKILSESLKHKEEKGKESIEYAIVEKIFSYLQIISACLMAFSHGANDVANAIGPLSAAINILSTGVISQTAAIPTWALGLGGLGIVLGLATWGWRVIETIGKKITELTPTRGFSAEFGASLTILLASRLGLPISTTHTLVGAVIGVALARGMEALDLRTTRYIVISWIVTVPAGAFLCVGIFYCINAFIQVIS